MKSDAQLHEMDWMKFKFETASGALDRLKKFVVGVANQPGKKLDALGIDQKHAAQFRKWLDALIRQANRIDRRYRPLVTTLDDNLGGMTISQRPQIDLRTRKLSLNTTVTFDSDLSLLAFVVAETLDSGLDSRLGKCPECERRLLSGSDRGKATDPKDGPYFVRDGRGDTRKFCNSTHTRAVTMRNARARKKLQEEDPR